MQSMNLQGRKKWYFNFEKKYFKYVFQLHACINGRVHIYKMVKNNECKQNMQYSKIKWKNVVE